MQYKITPMTPWRIDEAGAWLEIGKSGQRLLKWYRQEVVKEAWTLSIKNSEKNFPAWKSARLCFQVRQQPQLGYESPVFLSRHFYQPVLSMYVAGSIPVLKYPSLMEECSYEQDFIVTPVSVYSKHPTSHLSRSEHQWKGFQMLHCVVTKLTVVEDSLELVTAKQTFKIWLVF